MAFRQAYAGARAESLKRCGPIILVRGDQLILIHGKRRLEGTVVNEAYHDLKTVAHVPLARALAQRLKELVVGDLHQPGREVAAAAVAGQPVPRADEGLRHRVIHV